MLVAAKSFPLSVRNYLSRNKCVGWRAWEGWVECEKCCSCICMQETGQSHSSSRFKNPLKAASLPSVVPSSEGLVEKAQITVHAPRAWILSSLRVHVSPNTSSHQNPLGAFEDPENAGFLWVLYLALLNYREWRRLRENEG